MSVPPLSKLVTPAFLTDVLNAPNNAEIKPALQKLVRMETRKIGNPIQQLQARKTYLHERYRRDEDARSQELSQMLYGYLYELDEKLVEAFAEYAKEKRGENEEVFFTVEEMRTAIAALADRADARFLFLHAYAFALLQEEPGFLQLLTDRPGEEGAWAREVLGV